jgi:hypothetical protein
MVFPKFGGINLLFMFGSFRFGSAFDFPSPIIIYHGVPRRCRLIVSFRGRFLSGLFPLQFLLFVFRLCSGVPLTRQPTPTPTPLHPCHAELGAEASAARPTGSDAGGC